MDWSLRACGRHGHQTYAPDEPDLRGRLAVVTPAGEARAAYGAGISSSTRPGDPDPQATRQRYRAASCSATARSQRLFGLRGGGAAYHAEHHAESLLTVERAALVQAAKSPADQHAGESTGAAACRAADSGSSVSGTARLR